MLNPSERQDVIKVDCILHHFYLEHTMRHCPAKKLVTDKLEMTIFAKLSC